MSDRKLDDTVIDRTEEFNEKAMALQVLDGAVAMIKDPHNWAWGVFNRTIDDPEHPLQVCAVGAFRVVAAKTFGPELNDGIMVAAHAEAACNRALRRWHLPEYFDIIRVNDVLGRRTAMFVMRMAKNYV